MTATPDRVTVPRVESNGTAHDRPGLAGGPLVLIGGNCTPHGYALRAFLEATHALEGGTIVGITTASGDPAESARYWEAALTQAGAKQLKFPPLDRTDPASDAALAAAIEGAEGVFMGGGDQVKLVASLTGTESASALRALHARGGAVCGTSAGAAAVSELTMAGGEMDLEGNLVEQYIGPGLGLLGHGAIIDTHFSQRRRLQRLFLVVASNTELFGIGIDEDTALVVRDGVGEVRGAGGVTFVDGRDTVRFDNADDLDAGRQLTLSHLRVGIVGTGYHLNIQERELQELLDDPRGRRVRPRRVAPSR